MYSLAFISQILQAPLVGADRPSLTILLTDSRSVCFPEHSVFFALRTACADGHNYVASLYEKGVRSFVVSKMEHEWESFDASFVVVSDTLQALQDIAAYHRLQFDIPVIGISGSNGKTTVKEWLYQLLATKYSITRSPRSYNSQLGVPLSVWGLWEGTELGIFEAAISQPHEMGRLEKIIQPTIGIFTYLGEAHQESFSTMKEKCEEKLKLFVRSKVLIYMSGNPVVEQCIAEMNFSGKLIPCDSQHDAIKDNLTLCKAACRYLGMEEEELEQQVNGLEPISMRLEVIDAKFGCTLINDSYNSDLNSLDIALDFMARRVKYPKQKRVLVLSDIEQTGMPKEMLYTHVARLIKKRQIHTFVGVGPALMNYQNLIQKEVTESHFFYTTEEFLSSTYMAPLFEESITLIKGARSFHFEDIADQLSTKVHETILEVNLQSIVENLKYYRSRLQPHVKVVCMVKADAYGAGAVEVSRVLQEHRVDYLAVAVADEGVTLRKAGITQNIMVMNPEMNSLHTLFQYHLEPEVYSFRILEALIQEGKKQGITNYPIHIKLDTGMHRLGFSPEHDMSTLIEKLSEQPILQICSVFSHFVGSDSEEFDDFSEKQYNLFQYGAQQIQAAFPHHILKHICNSAGITHFPQRQSDMVRLGLGLYGIHPLGNALLHNASTLKTIILQIHEVPKGDSVGYSRRTILQRDSRIASIPIGYADGINRRLGNRQATCLVNGQRVPYVGNICMDVCMIDVTDVDCKEGDAVIIFGENLPVTELSDIIGTIPYEILTGISNRVKRVYYKDR